MKTRSPESLQDLFDASCRVLDALHVPYDPRATLSVNPRLFRAWARCLFFSRSAPRIEAAPVLTDVALSDNAVMETLIHELLHTCPGCANHGASWQAYARLVTRETHYAVTVSSSQEDHGLPSTYIRPGSRYALICNACGATWCYNRKCNSVVCPERYRCSRCGGSLCARTVTTA